MKINNKDYNKSIPELYVHFLHHPRFFNSRQKSHLLINCTTATEKESSWTGKRNANQKSKTFSTPWWETYDIGRSNTLPQKLATVRLLKEVMNHNPKRTRLPENELQSCSVNSIEEIFCSDIPTFPWQIEKGRASHRIINMERKNVSIVAIG